MLKRKSVDILLTVVTTLIIVVWLMAAGGGFCNPAVYGFVPGVMALMYPFVAVIAMVWMAIMLLLRHWYHALMVSVVWLITLPLTCSVFPLHLSHGTTHGDTFSVMTYNVASFPRFYTQDSSTVMRTILDINSDFVLMQDMPHWNRDYHYDTIKGLKPYIEELNHKYPYRSYSYTDDVAILSRYPFTIDTIVETRRGFETLTYFEDLEHCPAMAYDVVVHGHKLRLISVHLQSYGLSKKDKALMGSETKDVFDIMPGSTLDGMPLMAKLNRAFALRASDAHELRNAIDDSPENVIVCGDFNDVPGSYAYRSIMGNDMCDSWAQVGRGYTWTYSKRPFYFKIDHILFRGAIQAVDARVYNKVPLTYTGSDHYPQVTIFEFIK